MTFLVGRSCPPNQLRFVALRHWLHDHCRANQGLQTHRGAGSRAANRGILFSRSHHQASVQRHGNYQVRGRRLLRPRWRRCVGPTRAKINLVRPVADLLPSQRSRAWVDLIEHGIEEELSAFQGVDGRQGAS